MPHSAYLDPIKYDADNLGWAIIKRHGKLLMPPSLCFTQNKLNYVKMTSFCLCFFLFKTRHIYHKFLYMLNLHVSCKFCCVSGVLHL